jgi:carbonic anhydrase
MDFRLHEAIEKWLVIHSYVGDIDLVSVAGACKTFVADPDSVEAGFLFRQIELSHELHGSNRVILTQHEDCGAYGGTAAFASTEDAKKYLVDDMRKLKEKISAKWHGMDVQMLWIYQKDGGWDFEEVS